MDRIRRARGPLRSTVTKLVTELEAEVAKNPAEVCVLQSKLKRLEDAMNDVLASDQKMLDEMLDANSAPEEMDQETVTSNEYKDKVALIMVKVNNVLRSKSGAGSPVGSTGSMAASATEEYRNFKLPKIELKKFDGDIKEWLAFWAQFKNIHEDERIAAVDKFQYLRQSTVDGSKAREVVDSFPHTSENYPKAVAHLKSRFGNDDILVEVYVRELLRLVLQNNLKEKVKYSVSTLYDRLETQLRALESLGVTSDKFAAILYPMVESSLHEDVLLAWERSRYQSMKTAAVNEEGNPIVVNRLSLVMEFLRGEVESAERISLARAGFGLMSTKEGKISEKAKRKHEDIPTAAGLFSGNSKAGKKLSCIFCEKSHLSAECYKAKNMSFQEKKGIVQSKKACYYCLNLGHWAKNCRVKVSCTLCSKRHCVIMCPDLLNSKMSTAVGQSDDKVKTDSSLTNRNCSPGVLLQTLMVKMRSHEKTIIVRALIDSGSERSYITEKVAAVMKYDCIGHETTVHSLFGGVTTSPHVHKQYNVRLADLKENYGCTFKVLDQPSICGDIPKIRKALWMVQLKNRGIWLSDFGEDSSEIDVLIGADVCGKLETGKRIELPCGLVAKETLLGWTIMGKVPESSRCEENHNSAMVVTSLLTKEATIAELWRLDTIGIMDSAETKSKEEMQQIAMDHFLSTVEIEKDGRYVVHLPWIEGHPPLGSNRQMAEARLMSMTKKLVSVGIYDEYEAVFEDWEKSAIIEEVPPYEMNKAAHYVAHRAVVKENSVTTKIRPVFDASAGEKGSPALNNCIEKGPNLLELIPAIINRFRMKKIGVVSDIAKAFLQIKLKEKECDFLRFLWWQKDRKTFKVFRHKRVVFGVSSSPFLLGAVIKHILDRAPEELRETAELLRNSMYVDNCVSSVDSEEELSQFIVESQQMLSTHHFDLRGWEHSSIDDKDLLSIKDELVPVLGMIWNKKEDTLACDMRSFNFEEKDVFTKRKILSVTHKIFDMIGFTSPISLCPKIMLQETWIAKLGWDEKLPLDLRIRFKEWMRQLPLLSEVKVPRWFVGEDYNLQNITLHMFCDASKMAYAACVFIRVETESGVRVQLVQAKARVAPVKVVTIPRKELLSCCIGARLCGSVKKDLNLPDVPVFYWTDSTNALCWIRRDDQWGTFVWNRVREIRELSVGGVWKHVPGVLNPADLPSRGCNVKQLLKSKWWEGPTWLYESPEEWPNSEPKCDEDIINSEKKKMIVSCSAREVNGNTLWLLKLTTDYGKMLRLVCHLKRFIWNFRSARQDRKIGAFSLKEYEDAEKNIILLVQREGFAKKDPILRKMQIFVDEENQEKILRVKTKVAMRKDRRQFRWPVLLPSQHPIVDAIIRKKHLELCHAGTQTLMAVLREEYWIPRSRKVIRKVVSSCVRCRRFQAKSIVPIPVALPEDRVKDASVFEICGVDLTGPLFLKGGSKAWIVLFTCAVFRAVHLEIVTSLSSEAFLLAFRRFIARRGRPTVMYSDCGTNFVGAANSFGKLDWSKLSDAAATQRIEWKFIPPNAPWWGGWWERLIGLLKTLLRKVMGKASLTYEEMATILCDCEDVVNSRPLTYLSEDPEDLEPLTPKMFLRDVQEGGVPDLDEVDATALNKRCQYRLKIQRDLRERFRLEYLGQLMNRQKEKPNGTLAVGDIVFIGNDNAKRTDWCLGRIVEVVPGKDGNIRVARVRTAYGELLRPVQRLFPLEVSCQEGAVISKKVPVASTKEDVTTRSGRVIRAPERLMFE